MNNLSKVKRLARIKDNPVVETCIELDKLDDHIEKLDQTDNKLAESISVLGENINKIVTDFDDKIAKVETIKGDTGEKGIDGKDGADGKNGLNGKDGADGLDGKDGADGKDGVDGINGKDGSPDTPDQVIEKIHLSKKLIKRDKIEGLDDIDTKIQMLANRPPVIQGVGGGSSGIRDIRAGSGISVSKVNEIVTVSAPGSTTDEKVKLNALDATAGYLDDKITGYGFLTAETDPVFEAWKLATPPLYSETDPVYQSEKATLAKISPTAPTYSYTGFSQFSYPFQIVPAINIWIAGKSINTYSGKWIAIYAPTETGATPLNSLKTINLGDIEGITGNLGLATFNYLTSFSAPTLKFVGGNISISTSAPLLTTLDLSALEYCIGGFTIGSNALLNTAGFSVANLKYIGASLSLLTMAGFNGPLSFPQLVEVGGSFGPALANATALDFPELISVGNAFNFTANNNCGIYNFPKLANISGNFAPIFVKNSYTAMDFPELVSTGLFNPGPTTYITSMNFNKLTTINGAFSPGNSGTWIGMTTRNFPELSYVGGAFNTIGHSGITAVDFSKLVTVVGAFSPNVFTAVATWNLGALVTVGGSFNPQLAGCTTLTLTNLATVGGVFQPVLSAVATILSAPQLTSINGTLAPTATGLTTINFPLLKTIGPAASSGITLSSLSSVTTLDLHSLETTTGTVSIDVGSSPLTAVSLPVLRTVGGTFTVRATNVSSIDVPSLVSTGTDFYLNGLPAITTFSAPALTTVGGNCQVAGSANVANYSLPAMINYNGTINMNVAGATPLSGTVVFGTIGTLKKITGNITASGGAMSVTSVDNLLKLVASLDGTNGTTSYGTGKTINISGGTTAPPSGTGTTTTSAGSNFVGVTTTCTATVAGHGFSTGDYLTISGITTLTNANGNFKIVVDSINQFHYTIATQTATGAGTASMVIYANTTGKYAKQVIAARGATVTTN